MAVLYRIIATTLIGSQLSFGQIDVVYFKFIVDSKATYLKEGEADNYFRALVYNKSKFDGNLNFYIKGLLFEHNPSIMKKETMCKESENYPTNLLLADEVEDVMRRLQDKYPFGSKPSKDYPQMFVVCEKNDSIATLYEVKWRYYIE